MIFQLSNIKNRFWDIFLLNEAEINRKNWEKTFHTVFTRLLKLDFFFTKKKGNFDFNFFL